MRNEGNVISDFSFFKLHLSKSKSLQEYLHVSYIQRHLFKFEVKLV
jgi:hypothetical protein